MSDPVSSQQRFDRASERYERGLSWRFLFAPTHAQVARAAGKVQGLSALDVGCGTGGLLRRLSAAGASRLAGVDVSEGMLEVARGGGASFELCRASADALPFGDGEFDLVVSCMAFHHFPNPGAALREMHRVLKPGARVLIADLCGDGLLASLILAAGRRLSTDERFLSMRELAGSLRRAHFADVAVSLPRRLPRVMLLQARKA